MQTLTIPIKSPRQPPQFIFPERCIHCGQPKAGTRGISLDLSPESSKKSTMLELEPPLCQACIQLENRLEWFSLLPFTISALLLAGVSFLLLWLVILPILPVWDWLGIFSRMDIGRYSFILAGAGALLTALLGGTVAELGLRILAVPYFGKLIISRPLTVFAMLSDSHDIVGLRAKWNAKQKTLSLTFERDDMAGEFKQINGL